MFNCAVLFPSNIFPILCEKFELNFFLSGSTLLPGFAGDLLKSPFVGLRSESPLPHPDIILETISTLAAPQTTDRLDSRRASASPLFKESPHHPTGGGSRRNSLRQERQLAPPGSGRLPRTPEIGQAASRLLRTPDVSRSSSRRNSRTESVGGSPSPAPINPGAKKKR